MSRATHRPGVTQADATTVPSAAAGWVCMAIVFALGIGVGWALGARPSWAAPVLLVVLGAVLTLGALAVYSVWNGGKN